MKTLLLFFSLIIVFSISINAQSEEKSCCNNKSVETTQNINNDNSTTETEVTKEQVTTSAGVLVRNHVSGKDTPDKELQLKKKSCKCSNEEKSCCKSDNSDSEKPQ
ncbi:MAG: hypothetical protein Kow0098_18510 [Ignavibacteriaceae bacterium]